MQRWSMQKRKEGQDEVRNGQIEQVSRKYRI